MNETGTVVVMRTRTVGPRTIDAFESAVLVAPREAILGHVSAGRVSSGVDGAFGAFSAPETGHAEFCGGEREGDTTVYLTEGTEVGSN